MKKYLSLLMAFILLVSASGVAYAEFDPQGFTSWYIGSQTWMTVNNGHWSSDPADQPTDEEIELMLKAATLPQSAGGQTNNFFIVVRDVEEQRKIIGDKYCAVEDTSTEGTVTILVMADNIISNAEGRMKQAASEISDKAHNFAYLDAGIASGVLITAAQSMGYYTHFWGSDVGPNAPFDLANGDHQSMSLYIKDEYVGKSGYSVNYGEEDMIDPATAVPIRGNYALVSAIVIGKPIAEEAVDVVSFATYHGRPERWAFFDGVHNEAPLSNASYAISETEAVAVSATNEFIGVSNNGIGGTVKVKVIIDGGKIIAIEIIEHAETAGISDSALKDVPASILATQSVDVDIVAGATITSNAVKEAVADALAQAGL